MSRRLARETALQVLFQRDILKEQLNTAEEVQKWAAEFEVPEVSRDFAQELVKGTLDHLSEIDREIALFAKGWTINRMSNVDRNVIRLAAYEILFCKDIPARVSINEALELAKRFSGEKSAKFVNGILDRIAGRQSMISNVDEKE